MAKDSQAAPAPSAVTKAYQDAMARLSAGELSAAVQAMLRIHRDHLDSEEAYFVEEQLARVRRLWPSEAEKAGLTDEAWQKLQERAADRRSRAVLPPGARAVIAFLFVATAWSLLVAVAPRAAFLGRVDVPLIFRLAAAVIGLASGATAFGMLRLKWEAVNGFIILSPIFMIVTFIGMTESGDPVGKIVCGAALAVEIFAAWYVSKNSHVFVH